MRNYLILTVAVSLAIPAIALASESGPRDDKGGVPSAKMLMPSGPSGAEEAIINKNIAEQQKHKKVQDKKVRETAHAYAKEKHLSKSKSREGEKETQNKEKELDLQIFNVKKQISGFTDQKWDLEHEIKELKKEINLSDEARKALQEKQGELREVNSFEAAYRSRLDGLTKQKAEMEGSIRKLHTTRQ